MHIDPDLEYNIYNMKYLKSYEASDERNILARYIPPKQDIDPRVNVDLLSDLFLEYAEKWNITESEDVTEIPYSDISYFSITKYEFTNRFCKDMEYDLRIYAGYDKCKFIGHNMMDIKNEFNRDLEKFLNRCSSYGLKNSRYNLTRGRIMSITIK